MLLRMRPELAEPARPGHATTSEIPGEAAFDGVDLRVRGEFALVERAELGLRRKAPVEAGFDQRRVARDRHAGNGKARARALEGEVRNRRHIAEGMLPLRGGARNEPSRTCT